MAIPKAKDFEKKCYRVFHYKSGNLDEVIQKLRLYDVNRKNEVVRDHILIELRDAVHRWSFHDKEFHARHGPELEREVENEWESRRQEYARLVDGDILFRWVPRGIGQRNILQSVISQAQRGQDDRHGFFLNAHFNLQDSAFLVQHVGIYAGNTVIEIGAWGLERKPVTGREHYDLVVRSKDHAPAIAYVARSALRGSAYFMPLQDLLSYPLWDLRTVALFPHPGARNLSGIEPFLSAKNSQYQREGKKFVLQQRVICSHFVNAVLYAALTPGGTIAAATDHMFDSTFKVSPAQMWKEFVSKQGIWARAGAGFAGVQHKGHLDQNLDPSLLAVGLA